MRVGTPVYLDYNATTPLDPRVLDAMMPFLTHRFGNAASRHHQLGCDAAKAVEHAREQVATVIGADPREIVWTSGATEADNLAIKGVLTSPIYARDDAHVITVATEHKAVLDTCGFLADHGVTVSFLPVDSTGSIDLERLADAVTDRTVLVTIMHGNNETGVLHPIERIGRLCKKRGVLFHTDATQTVGKVPVDVETMGIALLSLSAHKMYGPKGVGALYVRRKGPRVRCEPLIHGGGHERGLRSGTLNVPAIVGLGAAAELCRIEMSGEAKRVGRLRDRLEQALLSQLDGVTVNGHKARCLPNTLNVSFAGVDGDRLMREMPEVAVSASSACTSAQLQPSYVLGAMGASDESIQGSLRFSLGRFTTEEEIDFAVGKAVRGVSAQRG